METYWKSTVAPQKIKPRIANKPITSANTSPSIHSPSFGVTSGGVVVSSLRGVYAHAIVQITKDMVPVILPNPVIPANETVSVGISDLTLEQVISLVRNKYKVYEPSANPSSTSEWISLMNTGFISLYDALQARYCPFSLTGSLTFILRYCR